MAPLDGVNDVLDATYGNRADLRMILFFGRIHHGSSHSMNHRYRILFFVVQHMRTSCAIGDVRLCTYGAACPTVIPLLPALHQGDIALYMASFPRATNLFTISLPSWPPMLITLCRVVQAVEDY